jgi:hypothetical protein
LDRLERILCTQNEKLDRLETLVYRIMHRDRVVLNEVNEGARAERVDERSANDGAPKMMRSKTETIENSLRVEQPDGDDFQHRDSGTKPVMCRPFPTERVHEFTSI